MKPEVRVVELINKVVVRTSAKKLVYLKTIDPTITSIQFQYGHLADVRERLRAQSLANPATRKTPLIWLPEDFITNVEKVGLIGVADIKLLFLHDTKKDYTRVQRENLVFNPVLIPIYNEFFIQLRVLGAFMQYGPFKHTRIDRPHWGNPAEWGNKGYLFDEPFDGIEVSDLNLQIYLANCVKA